MLAELDIPDPKNDSVYTEKLMNEYRFNMILAKRDFMALKKEMTALEDATRSKDRPSMKQIQNEQNQAKSYQQIKSIESKIDLLTRIILK